MKEKSLEMKNLARKLVNTFVDIDIENKKTIKLFFYIVHKLPRVILVDDEDLYKNCFLQGVIRLYSKKEFKNLSDQNKNDLRIYFRLMKKNEAIINSENYTGPELFKGSWKEALLFVLKKIEKSNIFFRLSLEKQKNLQELISILGGE